MALPLLLVAGAAGLGLFGAGKTIKAAMDNSEANDLNDSANSIVSNAKNKIDSARKQSGKAFETLGAKKVAILNGSIAKFIDRINQIKNFPFDTSINNGNLKFDAKSFEELKQMQGFASSLVGGAASGAIAGGLTAFGAYSAAMALGTTAGGTAIGTLSGVAATNATLAFFGGGSIAAGGLGMAGGAAVLGGIVAGPALCVLGLITGAKASANLDNARSNLAQAKAFRDEMDAAVTACNHITRRANMFTRLLIAQDSLLAPLVYEAQKIKSNDWNSLSVEDKEIFGTANACVATIDAILKTSILDEAGNLTHESTALIESF